MSMPTINPAFGPGRPNPAPGNYYVSAIDAQSGKSWFLLGPFATHQEALDRVDAVAAKACELDPRGVFMAYGTSRLKDDQPIITGKLNAAFAQ